LQLDHHRPRKKNFVFRFPVTEIRLAVLLRCLGSNAHRNCKDCDCELWKVHLHRAQSASAHCSSYSVVDVTCNRCCQQYPCPLLTVYSSTCYERGCGSLSWRHCFRRYFIVLSLLILGHRAGHVGQRSTTDTESR